MEEMMAVLRGQDICVLATASENAPHCSLMAYILDEQRRRIYMVTHKETKKYANLLANPTVSLLVDTRLAGEKVAREKVQALTVNGVFSPIEEAGEAEPLRERFIKKHPHLHDFAKNEKAVVFQVELQSLQLLNGATDASYKDLEG